MVLVVSSKNAEVVKAMLKKEGEEVYEIGMVVHRGANLGVPVKIVGMETAWNN